MEGLIPMFYRAMKKRRLRRQYSTLSPETSRSYSYNIADFYVNPPPCHVSPRASVEEPRKGHRRYQSFGGEERSGEGGNGPPPAQLVRFRSQRILSCWTANGH